MLLHNKGTHAKDKVPLEDVDLGKRKGWKE